MNMMDQLVADKEVDVFDAVKRVRQARPEFVENIVCLCLVPVFLHLCLSVLSYVTHQTGFFDRIIKYLAS